MHHRGLTRLTDAGSVSRGLDYARRGRARVTGSTTDPDTVQGLVRGSGGVQYSTEVEFVVDESGLVTRFTGICNCPVGDECKHAVALLLTELSARRLPAPEGALPASPGTVPASPGSLPASPVTQVGSGPVGAAGVETGARAAGVAAAETGSGLSATRRVAPAPKPPAWETALAGLASAGLVAGETATAPLALAFELVLPTRQRNRWSGNHGGDAPEAQLAVRPVCKGAQGRWIRTGISWSELSHGYARWKFRADHVRVLTAIARLHAAESRWNYSGTDPWIQLPTIGSPSLWELLAEGAGIGVELLTMDSGQPRVELSSAPAALSIDVARDSDGLRVTPVIELDGVAVPRDRVLFLGDPAHGVATWTLDTRQKATGLRLAALDHQADRPLRVLFDDGGVTVPKADEDRFLDDFVPMLRRAHTVRATDPAVALPEEYPPVLMLRVTPTDDHRTELDWQWIYRVADGERHLHVTAEPSGPGTPGVVRDTQAERAVLTTVVPMLRALPRLVGLGPAGRTPVAAVTLTGPETIEFVGAVLPLLQECPQVDVLLAGEFPDYRAAVDAPVITLGSAPSDGSRDWFDLTVTVTVGAVEVPFEQVFMALASGDELMILPDGGYFALDREEFGRLRALIEEARLLQDRPGGPLRISRFQVGLWDELQLLGVVDAQSTEWLSRVNNWRADPDTVDLAPPAGLEATLRPYQLAGFRWMSQLLDHGLGGILADDMGLGKTLQTLAMITRARESERAGAPFLVVAPTSVVGNWQAEARRFAPHLQTMTVTGTAATRGIALDEIVDGADIVVTSYTLFRLEFAEYDRLPFAGLVLDEAQVVKNHQSKAFACAKQLDVPVKFAITGTPMENNLMELWALFSIVAPGLFPSPVVFSDAYRMPIERSADSEALARLRRRIAPLMLRRTKEAVAADLPAKQEQVLELELEPAHRAVYQRQLQRERQKVLGLIEDMDKNRFAIFRSLMVLRQASIDPFLIDPENRDVPSTKLNVLMELLEDVVAEGHRTLIFSQFTGFLRRVRERLDADGVSYCYLDGSTRDRAKVLDEFRGGDAPVFLISLKAGGVGLNLTEADYCILLDPWWNPAAEAQAVDRTHRIGQNKKVMVYRLVSKDTIEEKVMALKASKSKLFAGVMSGDGADGMDDASEGGAGGSGKGITAADIRALLS